MEHIVNKPANLIPCKSSTFGNWRELVLMTEISPAKLPPCLRKWAWRDLKKYNCLSCHSRISGIGGMKPSPYHSTKQEQDHPVFFWGIWNKRPEWMIMNIQLFHERCLTMRLKIGWNPSKPSRCALIGAKSVKKWQSWNFLCRIFFLMVPYSN